MARRRLLLYILLAAVILAAAWLGGVAVRGASEDQDRPQEETPTVQRIARLEAVTQELIDRHPDYDLAEARRALQELQGLNLRASPKVIEALEARVGSVAAELCSQAAGLGEGMEGWDQACRFKSFSPNGFRDFYEGVRYAAISPLLQAPPVTGDAAADGRIAALALARGYRLRGQADQARLEREGRHALQAEAFAAWRALQAAARSSGLELALVSGYRSVDRQRRIFLAALERIGVERIGRAASPEELASGQGDELIDAVLRESSPPGFSKHHTGYTVDITDISSGLEFTDFGVTEGFAWISGRNFLNAKRFGFIPSYPQGAGAQGPDPEPWEYVWVGTELLKKRSASGGSTESGVQGK